VRVNDNELATRESRLPGFPTDDPGFLVSLFPHGFLNDTMPGRYRPKQAKVAWEQVISFLHTVLDTGWDRERVSWRFDGDISPNYDFTKYKRQA
jgi:hypothetical protein